MRSLDVQYRHSMPGCCDHARSQMLLSPVHRHGFGVPPERQPDPSVRVMRAPVTCLTGGAQ